VRYAILGQRPSENADQPEAMGFYPRLRKFYIKRNGENTGSGSETCGFKAQEGV
jgi:hypothetical protein